MKVHMLRDNDKLYCGVALVYNFPEYKTKKLSDVTCKICVAKYNTDVKGETYPEEYVNHHKRNYGMKKDESTVQQEIQAQAMHFNCTLMRNNSGALKDDTGRIVRFGLGNTSKEHNDRIKSSDLLGITKVTITPEMVGEEIGVFTSIEVKKSDWNPEKKFDKREQAQYNFIKWVRSLGGYAGFCHNVDKLNEIIRE